MASVGAEMRLPPKLLTSTPFPGFGNNSEYLIHIIQHISKDMYTNLHRYQKLKYCDAYLYIRRLRLHPISSRRINFVSVNSHRFEDSLRHPCPTDLTNYHFRTNLISLHVLSFALLFYIPDII